MSLKSLLSQKLFAFKQQVRAVNRRRLKKRRERLPNDYPQWLRSFDAPPPPWWEKSKAVLDRATERPCFTLLMSVDELDSDGLQQSLRAIVGQAYPHWRLILSHPDPVALRQWLDSRFQDDRMSILPSTPLTHAAHPLDWVIPLAVGDQLAPHACLVLAHHLLKNPEVAMVYSDHDVIDRQGIRRDPIFKPQWDPDLCLSQGYVHGLMLFRQWHAAFTMASQCLELTRQGALAKVSHIPHVLVHLRSTTPARQAQLLGAQCLAVQHHLERLAPGAQVQPLNAAAGLRIRWPLPSPRPLVSIVVPTRNQVSLLRKCIGSLLHRTDHPHKQVIVVDNGSDDAETLAYLDEIRQLPNVLVKRDDGPFNYSALNNNAVRELARGEFILLMNNDVEAIKSDWLDEMLSQAARPGIGCVGARLLYSDDTIQHGGVILGIGNNSGRRGVAAHAHKALSPDQPGYAGRAQVVQRYCAVTAACLLVRRSIFDQVGGLDEAKLAVAYNDVDFCLRVREAGFANLWTPHATLYHHESVSRGKDMAAKSVHRFLKEAEYMRNRWGPLLDNDPAYNPNLTQDRASFQLAWPPRVSWDDLL